MSNILEYLSRNEQELDGFNKKTYKMDIYQQDGLMTDNWHASDDLLENIFSLDQGSFSFLDDALPDFNLEPVDPTQPEGLSSSCSDSGVSSDPAEFDFEQSLSPCLIQNPCNDASQVLESMSSEDSQDVVIQETDTFSSNESQGSAAGVVDFERDIVSGFFNKRTFHNAGKGTRKRRLSQTPQASAQPKLPKGTVNTQKPQLVVKAQPQRPVKLANVQVIHPQPTKVYSKPVEPVAPQRRVIRVAPMAGNPRSILLPVTIKDMKDLKSIKIINAADLKHAPNIKIAAANLLSQRKLQELKVEARADYDYEQGGNNCDDSGSDHSDDDEPEPRDIKPDAKGYPRLVLTAEERRLLAKEGISLPSSYPLTKHEERELKRIRRKIRNKISAQDSRKRKKEYVDGLEDRVKQCSAENQTLMRRIKILQSQNQTLSAQLKRLQSVLTGVPNGASGKTAQPATCLLVLLLSVALVALPSVRDELQPRLDAHKASEAQTPSAHSPHAVTRALLSATSKMALEETVIDDGEFNMDELITFHRPPLDHDYQVVKTEPKSTGGYIDLPIDEDWPPSLKRRKRLEFDYGDGRDYLMPIVKEEHYENLKSRKSRSDLNTKDLIANALLSTTRKLGEFLDSFPPIGVNSEELVIEEVADDVRNTSEVKSFAVGGDDR